MSRRELPKAIVPYHSADKRLIEEWTPGRDPANFPSPFRMLLLGPPGGGKTSRVLGYVRRTGRAIERCLASRLEPIDVKPRS